MEEDAGKNLHAAAGVSFVDYNRAGVPLCEVVSEPDIRSAEEAAEYVRAVRTLVRYLGISDGNMEEGSLRCDANVSIRPKGETKFGTKAELKNINSFKNVKDAIEHEIKRQAGVLERGERVIQETRLWDASRGVSASMRSKEQAHDYRYFPEPDLPPLVVDEAWLARVRSGMPELPEDRFTRYTGELGLSAQDAGVLVSEKEIADYFDAVLGAAGAAGGAGVAKKAANWVLNEVLARVEDPRRLGETDLPVPPVALAELVALVEGGTLSSKLGKDVFGRMWQEKRRAGEIVSSEAVSQVSDSGVIEEACRKVVAANPDEVARYKAGNAKLIGFFVGQVMKETGGKANPKSVNEVLRKLLA
jgi:aspartyl-tRNA(Asn)/glutamyl-tRNA(Gln) amidotransferase subunit B